MENGARLSVKRGFFKSGRCIAVLSCLLLVGCGFAARLAYNNLDWLGRRWVSDYVQLDQAQQGQFEASFQRWWQWHRETQLPAYATSLEAWARDAENGVSRAEIHQVLSDLERYTLTAMEAGFADMVVLMRELDDEQILSLLGALQDAADEYREDVLERSPAQRRKKYARALAKLLRRWLGKLTAEQQVVVDRWAQSRQDLAQQWLDSRLTWREALGDVLRARDETDFEARIRSLIFAPQERWSDAHREAVQANQQGQLDMLETVLALAKDRQLDHLRAELLRLAELCKELGV